MLCTCTGPLPLKSPSDRHERIKVSPMRARKPHPLVCKKCRIVSIQVFNGTLLRVQNRFLPPSLTDMAACPFNDGCPWHRKRPPALHRYPECIGDSPCNTELILRNSRSAIYLGSLASCSSELRGCRSLHGVIPVADIRSAIRTLQSRIV